MPTTASNDFFGCSMPESSTRNPCGQTIEALPGKGVEKLWLFGDVPARVTWAVVRQRSAPMLIGPRANPGVRRGDKMFHNCGAKHFEEEIFVRLAFLPEFARFFLQLFARAHQHQRSLVRPSVVQGFVQPLRMKLVAIEPDARTARLDGNGLCINPRAGRAPRHRERAQSANSRERPSRSCPDG